MASDEYKSELETIPNFRDVGYFVNEFCDKFHDAQSMKLGRLYRGARPDDASFLDGKRLLWDYQIKSIIDLRTKTEHIEQAKKRGASIHSSSAAPQTDSDTAESLEIKGITYHYINFNGSAFSWMLISKLTWLQFFLLLFFMVVGQRKRGIRILAPHMETMGLTGLATSSLDVCTREVKAVFDILADETQLPVFIHCTQGKDRTGLVVMLLLFLLGFNVPVVEHDYLLSGPGLASEIEERVREIEDVGLSRQFAEVKEGMVLEIKKYLDSRYGGVEGYMEGIGVDGEMQKKLKRNFIGSAA